MKNKLFKLILISAGLFGLSSCGNHDIGYGSYTFTKTHVQMYGMSKPTHLKVKRWRNDDGGIELVTETFGNIILGDGTYLLYSSEKCPICGKVECE